MALRGYSTARFMIFTGHISAFKCEKCHAQFREVIPNSLFPAIVVVGVCMYPWTKVLMQFTSYRWVAVPASFVVSGVCMYSIDLVIDLMMNWRVPGQSCPKCEGQLRHAGGGFYESLLPNLWEFVVYALSLLVAFGAAFFVRG